MSLATDYRPRSFSEIHGQRHVVLVLEKMLDRWHQGEIGIPAGIMLVGTRGSGKTTSARIIAAALNCTAASGQPCGVCGPCVATFKMMSDSVMELDGATSGNSEAIRDLAAKVRLAHSGKYRVIIIDECHAMSREGQTALLKQLEEPLPGVLYILVTTDFHTVLPTVTSRCLTFMLNMVNDGAIVARLEQICAGEKLTPGPGLLALIAKRSSGALRDAVMFLEQIAMTGDLTVERANDLWPDNMQEFVVKFLKTASSGDIRGGMANIESIFREVHDSGILMEKIAEKLRDLAITSHKADKPGDVRQVSDLIKILWEFKLGTRNAGLPDPTPLEGLWFAFCRVFERGKPQAGAPKSLMQQVQERTAAGLGAATQPTPDGTVSGLSAGSAAAILGEPAPKAPTEAEILAELASS